MKAATPWPITQWVHTDGTPRFTLEDDQGYNFSFPSRHEAESMRELCQAFLVTLATTELRRVATGYPMQRVPKVLRKPVDASRDSR